MIEKSLVTHFHPSSPVSIHLIHSFHIEYSATAMNGQILTRNAFVGQRGVFILKFFTANILRSMAVLK